MMPKENICQGVHGPLPVEKIGDKPGQGACQETCLSAKTDAVMMTIAAVGLNCGSIKKAARPATARPAITAMTTISRAWGLRFSNTRKNGSMDRIITQMEIK